VNTVMNLRFSIKVLTSLLHVQLVSTFENSPCKMKLYRRVYPKVSGLSHNEINNNNNNKHLLKSNTKACGGKTH
jgi:hypothetical protein